MAEKPSFGEVVRAIGGERESSGLPAAGEYAGLSTGPGIEWSYEDQSSIPVDGSSRRARQLSPFTIRILPPAISGAGNQVATDTPTVNVDLIGDAVDHVSYAADSAAQVASAFGITAAVNGDNIGSLADTLYQGVAAGQYLSSASGTQIRTTLTDSTTALDIAAQVARILATPPLILLVNPTNMTITYTPVQGFSDRGREGFIFQRWGEEQVNIKFSGTTGAFIAGQSSTTVLGEVEANGTDVATGVQFASKRDSAAFQNFQTLFQFYRNNGYIYDTVNRTEAHQMVGAIAIDYDQWTYVGHIESFNYSYSSESPHRIEWDMEFIVDVMFDNAEQTSLVLPMQSPTPNPTTPGGTTPTVGEKPRWGSASGATLEEQLGAEFGVLPFDLANTGSGTNPDGSGR